MTRILLGILILLLSACSGATIDGLGIVRPKIGTMEIVAKLPVNPGNVTICPNVRLFATVHQFRPSDLRLVEVMPPDGYHAYPSQDWNSEDSQADTVWNSPLGVQCDKNNVLWVIDNGAGKPPTTPKLVAIDTNTNQVVYRYDFPKEIAAPGSFVQDLAVDSERGLVYLADVGGDRGPALIFFDTKSKEAFRFSDHESLRAEDIDLVVEGKVLSRPFSGEGSKPARIGVNPITLSADNETLYFGAMNGTRWYSVPTLLFRQRASSSRIRQAISIVGPKPVSDGAATDKDGNHFFTAVNENSIVALRRNGELETLVKDERLIWPDALAFGPDLWLYIAVNQLNRSAPLNDGKEAGKPPYLIARVWTNTQGVVGR